MAAQMKLICTSGFYAMASAVLRRVPLLATAMDQTRGFAARKGTRERKLKIKKARKLQRQAQAAQREAASGMGHRGKAVSKMQLSSRFRTSLDLTKSDSPTDDVWVAFCYQRKLHPLKDAIEMHREVLHPTVMNLPDAPLYLSLELDMTAEKKNKYLNNFSGVISLPHYFDDGKPKTVIAFGKVPVPSPSHDVPIDIMSCQLPIARTYALTSGDEPVLLKDDSCQQDAIRGGADMVGGLQLIKRVQGGEALLADYKYIVAHPDILTDLGSLRGIMKRRFPNINRGTVSADLHALVEHFKRGVEYVSERDGIKPDFGWVDVQVGHLNMSNEDNESNIENLVKAVCSHRPAKLGHFVTAAVLTCPPSREKIIVDVTPFLPPVPLQEEEIEDETAVVKKR